MGTTTEHDDFLEASQFHGKITIHTLLKARKVTASNHRTLLRC